jgi:hypothetical protein
MEPSNLIEWALYLGLAFFVFSVIIGLDEVIAKFTSGSLTKKYLAEKVDKLEERVNILESAGVK